MMWVLRARGIEDKPDGKTFRLSDGAVKTVGSAPRADFVLDAALVSRLHCCLEAEGEALVVVDLDSTNGTCVNGKRVERVAPGVYKAKEASDV